MAQAIILADDGERAGLVEWPDDRHVREAYRRFARPRTAEVLHAIGLDVVFERAEGDYVFFRNAAGAEVGVLDMVGGFGSTLFGHNHPELVEALQFGLRRSVPCHVQASARRYAALLAERLSARAALSTGGRSYIVTLSNSGAEAVEAAVKHARMEEAARTASLLESQRRRLARARIELGEGRLETAPGSSLGVTAEEVAAQLDQLEARIAEACAAPAVAIALVNSFHGKTLGALQLTHNPLYRAPWEQPGAALFVSPDDGAGLVAAVAAHTHAMPAVSFDDRGRLVRSEQRRVAITGLFLEPIQGEGGVRPLAKAFLEGARALADETGVPLILDEIQCGMGRTGRFFAAEAAGVAGDYYILSKSLGGALVKIGATLVVTERYQRDFGFLHTSTFAEDDLGCLVALRALELVERADGALLRECASKGELLLARLRVLQAHYPEVIAEVRGRGLMIGVELAPQPANASPFVRLLSDQNLLGFLAAGYLLHHERIRVAPALSAHATIRLEPSASIPRAEIARLVDALDRFCGSLRDGDVSALFAFAMDGQAAPASAPASAPVGSPVSAPTVVSARAPSPAPPPVDRGRVAFLAHFRGGRDLQLVDSGFNIYSVAACEHLAERVAPLMQPFLLAEAEVQSPRGTSVAVDVIGVPFTARQAGAALRGGSTVPLVESVRAAVELARRRGASMVGCGGYTSILTDNCRDLAGAGVALTSGNSLTVAAAVSAIERMIEAIGARRRVLGIVGAAGNIGAALADLAADFAESVVLVGRPTTVPRLRRVAERLKVPARIETDLHALADCTMIVSASNAPAPIIRAEHLGHQPTVLCDLAVPRDVDASVISLRPNTHVIRGGIVRLPQGQKVDVPALDLPDGAVYACFAEAVILGLAASHESFSFGPIRPERVRRIRALAREHAFDIGVEAWNPNTIG